MWSVASKSTDQIRHNGLAQQAMLVLAAATVSFGKQTLKTAIRERVGWEVTIIGAMHEACAGHFGRGSVVVYVDEWQAHTEPRSALERIHLRQDATTSWNAKLPISAKSVKLSFSR